MNKRMKLSNKIVGSLTLPIAMYLVMMIACYMSGKTYWGTWEMWKILIVDIGLTVSCAMGIGLQFKSGRFDFSGGGIMLVSVIIAGNVAKENGDNLIVFMVLCMVISIILSVIVSLVYIYVRLPIVITTIGMAMLYESITCLIYNGAGVKLVNNMKLKVLSMYPYVLFPLVGAITAYTFFSYLTVSGKQSILLANNQQSAVNIGIKENKNVVLAYVFSGIIFGFASMIFASMDMQKAAFTSLSTVGSLFSNILPVFIGLMLGKFCGDTIGTIIGAVTLCLMSYGLTIVFNAEMGSAITTICTGIFIFGINVISAQGSTWIQKIRSIFFGEKITA